MPSKTPESTDSEAEKADRAAYDRAVASIKADYPGTVSEIARERAENELREAEGASDAQAGPRPDEIDRFAAENPDRVRELPNGVRRIDLSSGYDQSPLPIEQWPVPEDVPPQVRPTIGRIVRYRLSDADVAAINKRREDFTKSRASLGDTGMQAHWGRPAIPGADMAAVVVAEIDDPAGQDIVLQVFLVGNDTLYVESPEQGPRPGQWHWPKRV